MRRLGLVFALVLAASGCTWAQRVDVREDRTTPAIAADHARNVAVDFQGDLYTFITPVGLVPEDTNGSDDVYRALADGGSDPVLVPTAADIGSYSFKGTEYGNEVLFTSGLALTTDDTNTHPDVYVRNVDDGSLERLSVATSGEIGGSLGAVLDDVSRDGHFVVFDVKAANDDMVLFLTGAAGATPPVIGQ